MGRTKAAFWLGRMDTDVFKHPRRRGGVMQDEPASDAPPVEQGPCAERLQLDCQLLAEAVGLFEKAFLHFEERGDLEAQRCIDVLAISVIGRIQMAAMEKSVRCLRM